MTHDQIGIALGSLVGVLMAFVFILFVKDFEQYADCPIAEFFGFIVIVFVIALIAALAIS